MRYTSRLITAFISLFSMVAACGQASGAERYVKAKEDDATIVIKLTLSLRDVFNNSDICFYLRPARDENDEGSDYAGAIPAAEIGPMNARVTYTLSGRPEPTATTVDLKIKIRWSGGGAFGETYLVIPVKYSQNAEGEQAGFTYSVTWEDRKVKPNKEPAPTTSGITPAADAPVVSDRIAAHP